MLREVIERVRRYFSSSEEPEHEHEHVQYRDVGSINREAAEAYAFLVRTGARIYCQGGVERFARGGPEEIR